MADSNGLTAYGMCFAKASFTSPTFVFMTVAYLLSGKPQQLSEDFISQDSQSYAGTNTHKVIIPHRASIMAASAKSGDVKLFLSFQNHCGRRL